MRIVLLGCLVLCSTAFRLAPLQTIRAEAAGVFPKVTGPSNGVPFSDELMFEDSISALYDAIKLARYDLSYQTFKYAMTGYFHLHNQGKLSDKKLISIIDFTRKSSLKRFYTIDLEALAVKFFTYVSHGKNTGEDKATSFSNVVHSNQSSLGFYITGETYVGSKGYSLRLDGMEKGYNDRIRERAVVIHNADYVSEDFIKKYGRLGRSQGCPALPVELGRKVIDVVKGKTMIFAYFNDDNYLQRSAYLNPATLFETLTASAKAVR